MSAIDEALAAGQISETTAQLLRDDTDRARVARFLRASGAQISRTWILIEESTVTGEQIPTEHATQDEAMTYSADQEDAHLWKVISLRPDPPFPVVPGSELDARIANANRAALEAKRRADRAQDLWRDLDELHRVAENHARAVLRAAHGQSVDVPAEVATVATCNDCGTEFDRDDDGAPIMWTPGDPETCDFLWLDQSEETGIAGDMYGKGCTG